jgi:hypothetical protein
MFRLFTSTARRARISRTTSRFRLRLEHLETRDTPSTTVPTDLAASSDDTGTGTAAIQQDDWSNDDMSGASREYDGSSSNCTLSISLSWTEEDGLYFLTGSVSGDEDVYGLEVSISGSFPGISGSATVASNGTFTMCFSASPGQFGTAEASVTDSHGHSASAETTISI